MSSVLHPVGPEGRGTYWRRRLVVLLALVAVVVLAAVGIRALTSSEDAAAQQPTKLDPSQVASPDQSPTDDPTDPTGSPTGTSSASPTETGSVGPCQASALSVTLTSNTTTYGPGATPRLVLTVENTSESTCSAEIGSAVRTFTVTDEAGSQVWSSEDCQSETASQVYDLEPGTSRSMAVTWSRQRSAAGCPDGQEMVGNGNYTVDASWDGVSAEPVKIAFTG
ncbi:RodZ family helix-turn-helix domain-containing protein [Kineococcus sp. SYSU DK003]|uniref:hypothetical protein n=1 Tax=Kineococcus sp. SYSU DK003 TaxID=3383124 RepID=UPI003D7C71B6